jgi:hypothetical protein
MWHIKTIFVGNGVEEEEKKIIYVSPIHVLDYCGRIQMRS